MVQRIIYLGLAFGLMHGMQGAETIDSSAKGHTNMVLDGMDKKYELIVSGYIRRLTATSKRLKADELFQIIKFYRPYYFITKKKKFPYRKKEEVDPFLRHSLIKNAQGTEIDRVHTFSSSYFQYCLSFFQITPEELYSLVASKLQCALSNDLFIEYYHRDKGTLVCRLAEFGQKPENVKLYFSFYYCYDLTNHSLNTHAQLLTEKEVLESYQIAPSDLPEHLGRWGDIGCSEFESSDPATRMLNSICDGSFRGALLK